MLSHYLSNPRSTHIDIAKTKTLIVILQKFVRQNNLYVIDTMQS